MSLILHRLDWRRTPRRSFIVRRTDEQRAKDRAERAKMEVLEAIEREPNSRRYELCLAFGHSHLTVYYGIKLLLESGCVVKVRARSFITERGKIALAIWRGRQHRARQQNGTIKT
jgi:hypothetical protein